jgi:hypothetical protein
MECMAKLNQLHEDHRKFEESRRAQAGFDWT